MRNPNDWFSRIARSLFALVSATTRPYPRRRAYAIGEAFITRPKPLPRHAANIPVEPIAGTPSAPNSSCSAQQPAGPEP